MTKQRPGIIRDAIVGTFQTEKREMSVAEVHAAVEKTIGEPVASSSVRSYLNLNTPGLFLRGKRGYYKMVRR